MIFSKKKITLAYTVEKCPKCRTIKKRRFSEGDVLFKSSDCSSCDDKMLIEKIYGETLEQ